MSAPTPYALAYDFTAFQAASPSTPLPADKIEIEYNAIATTTDGLIANLGLIQRSDGALANGIVTPVSLSTATLALIDSEFSLEGAWVTATAYALLDMVTESGNTYACIVAHTSGTFATDLAAAKWMLWAGTSSLHASLTSIAGLTTAADKMIYTTASNVYAVTALTSFARTILDDTTASAVRTTLGVAIGTDVQAYDATLTAFAGGLTAANKIPYATDLNTLGELDFVDEDNMVSNSATAVPSQQSVKAYVDGRSDPGLVLLATASASASATVDFTALIDSSYEHYILEIIDLIPATDNTAIHLRTSTDGGSSFDAGASDYGWSTVEIIGDGAITADAGGDSADSEIHITAQTLGNAAGESYNAIIHIFNPAGTNNTLFRTESSHVTTNGFPCVSIGSGVRYSAADVNGLRVLMSSGNITSGKFKLYGVKK